MTTDEERLLELGRVVAQHRAALGLSKDGAAAKAGISRITWRKVEDGRSVRDTMYAAVEKTLGWAPGSVARVLAGGKPSVAAEKPVAPEPDAVENAAKVLGLVLAQYGKEVFEAAYEVVEGEQPDTVRNRTRRA